MFLVPKNACNGGGLHDLATPLTPRIRGPDCPRNAKARATVWTTRHALRSGPVARPLHGGRTVARPKKEQQEARTVRLNLRFSPGEWSEVEPKAASAGLVPTEFCRLAVLGQPTPAVSSPPRTAFDAASSPAPSGTAHIVALNRVGVNLNQIARALNANTGFIPADLEDTLRRVNEVLDVWQGVSK